MTIYVELVARALNISVQQVEATVRLLEEGGTIPFISRYRKEATGSLDEVQIGDIRDRLTQLQELDKRKAAILTSMKEQGKLTDELTHQINEAQTMTKLEDIYLPYKPKRRTRAMIAREKGLEPLAQEIFEQRPSTHPEQLAQDYVATKKEVESTDDALQGARDIIAEWMNEDPQIRAKVRDLFFKEGTIQSKVIKGKEDEGAKFKDYFEWEEPLKDIPSHRLLAMRRGEKEMMLLLNFTPPEEASLLAEQSMVKNDSPAGEQVALAVRDGFKRLLKPSLETEVRLATKTKADAEAIKVFTENVRQLLLSPPLGEKNILALDPGFRTGCKLVCLNKQGKLLHNTAIYPNEPQRKQTEAAHTILELCQKYNIEAIAIGNGTASRETESFVRGIAQLPKNMLFAIVNESGASIYSASPIAREEFPDQDVTVRGAVSIGRRLMDPLAELVKLDPKSIGVGQYQHDVDQQALKFSLDDTVMRCVNHVGVELNTASKQLLTYVSGLGPSLAQNIIDFRNQHGAFKNREELKKVPRLGGKAFEQSAGFLRISDANNPLDRSGVHPERYDLVAHITRDLGCAVEDLIRDSNLRKKVDLKRYVSDEVGLPTLQDIMAELEKPGRDPRAGFEQFSFTEGVHEIKDLTIGLKLNGIVTNITKFGVFVDIGVHQDGLIHISHLADKFVSDPGEVVKVQQKVEVTIIDIDLGRKRISLSMKSDPFGKQPPARTRKPSEDRGDLSSKLNMLKNKFKS